jgi:hypothetical protein
MTRLGAAILVAFALAGCHGESSRPEATGKGSIRAINAIPVSTDIAVRVEERSIAGVSYKESFAPSFWDNLSYTFNFDAVLALGEEATRIASQPLDVVADIEYTMVIRGDLQSPTISIWEIPERDFSDSTSIFEMRVGHASASMGTVDVYYALEGVAPVLGEQIATLAPGEVTAAADYNENSYVLTVTVAGDPGNVLLRTAAATVAGSQSVLISLFDGDGNDTSPYVARIFNQVSLATDLPDDRFLPTIRYIHATSDLGTSDLYDDSGLTNRIFAALPFGDTTGDLDTPLGETPITFTAVDNVGSTLFATTVTTALGSRQDVYVIRGVDGPTSQQLLVDRRSIGTIAKLAFFHASTNHVTADLYVVDPGQSIDEVFPAAFGVVFGFRTGSIALAPGDYDLYVTTSGEKTVLDGPIPFTAVLGAVYDGLLIDRTDPGLAEFKILPPP